jgi:sister-chromatid-cohesion protein PDS5
MKEKLRKSNLGVNILSTHSKPCDLLEYLKELHSELSILDQDVLTAPMGLYDTAINLLGPKLLQNPNKEVRVLICCCLVDILRIYAPDAPFPESDILKVFELINTQIKCLQNIDQSSYLGEKVFYILNSLASVKSCVLPVLMGQNGIPGAEDTVHSMFLSIISSIRPEHSQESKSIFIVETKLF